MGAGTVSVLYSVLFQVPYIEPDTQKMAGK